MNTPTKQSSDYNADPGAPMKDMIYRSPNATTNSASAPGAPEKKGAMSTVSDTASSMYNGLKANLFGPENPPVGGKKRRSMKKSRKSRKSRKGKKGGNPKKGMSSKTRKGKKDYVTHKGNKYYNRKGKRQTMNRKGRKGKPYSKRR